MKGWILAGLAAGAALTMVGCNPPADNGETGGTTGTTSGNSSEDKPKIAVVIPTATHGWTGGVVYWATKAKEDLAGEADIEVFASESAADQATKLDAIAGQGFDGLVILSFEPAAVTQAVKTNKDSFKYIVSVDRGLSEPIADVWMRGDNKKFGTEAAKFMAEKLGGKGNILVLQGIPGDVDSDRVAGFEEVMKGYPNIKILDKQVANWNQAEALTKMQTMLLTYKNVDAVWAADDDMALGAQKALQEAGMDKVWIVGGGGSKDVIGYVKDGNPMFPATVTYSPMMIKLAIEKCLEDLKAGKTSTGTQVDQVLPVELVTPSNAQDHFFPDSVY